MTGGVCPSAAAASEYCNQAGKAVRRAYTYTQQTFMEPIKVPINNLWPEYEIPTIESVFRALDWDLWS